MLDRQIGDASGTLQDIFRMISNSQVAYNRDVRTRTHKAPNFMPLSHLFVSVDNVFSRSQCRREDGFVFCWDRIEVDFLCFRPGGQTHGAPGSSGSGIVETNGVDLA